MATYKELRFYLLTLKYFGLLCFAYERRNKILKAKWQNTLYARLVLVFLLTVFATIFLYCATCPQDFYLKMYNNTGNIYLCFEICFCCVLLSFICCYCHLKRHQQLRTVQQLLKLNIYKPLPKHCRKKLQYLYGFYVFLTILCCQNYSKAFWYSDLPFPAFLSYSVILTLNFSICGMIMIWYICLEMILKHHFWSINIRLQKLMSARKKNEFKKVHRLLKCRYSLLCICRDDINSSYGPIMLVISSYIVFSAPAGIFFMISVVMEKKMPGFMNNFNGAITSALWNLPWLTIFIWTFSANQIDGEANKTAKILSKVPRTGTGIEKMVQKFLLKNLRQKPILTAYGFFSLDKSTLFKLFTAIFTYMVILVQFKEMESSRKQLKELN